MGYFGRLQQYSSSQRKNRGKPVHPNEIKDFVEYMEKIGVTKLSFSSSFYTWSNSSQGNAKKWSRLDGTLVNLKWLETYANATMVAQPPESSNHSPILVEWLEEDRHRHSFKFCNYWTISEFYMPTLLQCWGQNFRGDPLYVLHKKLRLFKEEIRLWARRHCLTYRKGFLRSK